MAKVATTKFKVGDRVRITKDHSIGYSVIGKKFVIEYRDCDWDGFASWSGEGSHPFRYREDQLEFASKKTVKKEGWIISATGKVSEKRFTDNQVYDTEKEAKTRTPDYYLNPSWHKIEWEEIVDVPIDDDTI